MAKCNSQKNGQNCFNRKQYRCASPRDNPMIECPAIQIAGHFFTLRIKTKSI